MPVEARYDACECSSSARGHVAVEALRKARSSLQTTRLEEFSQGPFQNAGSDAFSLGPFQNAGLGAFTLSSLQTAGQEEFSPLHEKSDGTTWLTFCGGCL